MKKRGVSSGKIKGLKMRSAAQRRKSEHLVMKHAAQLEEKSAELEKRTAELEEMNLKLKGKNDDLERFKKLTVGRELRMVEIERENEKLKKRLK